MISHHNGRGIRGFTKHVTHTMKNHDWPGKLRELQNRVERTIVMADRRMIDAADLELAVPVANLRISLSAVPGFAERNVIQGALLRSNNALSEAARLLGVRRPTLCGLLEVHGLAHEALTTATDATASTETTIQDN